MTQLTWACALGLLAFQFGYSFVTLLFKNQPGWARCVDLVFIAWAMAGLAFVLGLS